MKLFFRILILLFLIENVFCFNAVAQTGNSVNRVKQKLGQLQQQSNYLSDTSYASTLLDLAYLYALSYPDSALLILKGNAARCHTLGYYVGEVATYMVTGDAFQTKGIYDTAMENYENALQLSKKFDYPKGVSLTLTNIAMC